MNRYLRAAFLPDTFHEVNGVALTSRQLESFARRKQIPFLSIHCGEQNSTLTDGAVTVMELKRGRASIELDTQLDYDPFLLRYFGRVRRQVKSFGAEVIHVTGPGDMGFLGLCVALSLRIPLVISWHTNLHEYSGRRLERLLTSAPRPLRRAVARYGEMGSLRILQFFYSFARVVLAPNTELVQQLHELTGKPTFIMRRGVDTNLFSPSRRNRSSGAFRIGYVGRLTAEKNVRFLADIGSALLKAGRKDFEFVIVGQGNEQPWLEANLPNARFTGVLRGEELAREFANMDLFVFPSTTDTFGNVILEAMASGVPAVVTSEGGPKFLVQSGVTGYVASDFNSFKRCVKGLLTDLDTHHAMREAARHYACGLSWDGVFEKLFSTYRHCYNHSRPTGAKSATRPDAARLTA
ncbi:MAG: glycosyltransferase [Bryobacteraceae bacterium]